MKNLAKAIGAEYDFGANDKEGVTSYVDEYGETRYIVIDEDGTSLDLSEKELDNRLKRQREKLAGYIIEIDGRGKNPLSKNIERNLGFILDSGININSSTKSINPMIKRPNTLYGYNSEITDMDKILDLEKKRCDISSSQKFEIVDDLEELNSVAD